jgi:hypothetical protein
MLIAEIILTFFAWRRGWKWFALIPGGVAMFIGFCMGASGQADLSNPLQYVWVDGLAILALIAMLIWQKPNTTGTPPAPGV